MAANGETDETRDQPVKIVMEPDVAIELAALLVDEPGDADEDLLDDALDALDASVEHIPSEDQQEVAVGELVAVQVEPEEVEMARTLIEHDQAPAPGKIKRLGKRLRSRIHRAQRRQADLGERVVRHQRGRRQARRRN